MLSITIEHQNKGRFPSYNVVLDKRIVGGGVVAFQGLILRAFHYPAPDKQEQKKDDAINYSKVLADMLNISDENVAVCVD